MAKPPRPAKQPSAVAAGGGGGSAGSTRSVFWSAALLVVVLSILLLLAFQSSSPPPPPPPPPPHPLLLATYKQRTNCTNVLPNHECDRLRQQGECTRTPGWMMGYCALACKRCHLQLQQVRCHEDVIRRVFNETGYSSEPTVLRAAGDVNRLMAGIYKRAAASKEGLSPEYVSVDPPVLTLRGLVSGEERDALLRHTLPTMERSQEHGEEVSQEGIPRHFLSADRTSSNSWCGDAACERDPAVVRLVGKLSALLGMSERHFESLQVLKYGPGEYYNRHHDSSLVRDLGGPRVLTVFLYLNNVTEGGETWFDQLGVKVAPSEGSAVIWPSVLDSNPEELDGRMTHAALPVIRGEKLAANLWVHARDFKTPEFWGCTM